MNNSQNLIRFLFLFIPIIWLGHPVPLYATSAKEQLTLADSLFEAGKYTQSYEIYENILNSERKASPSMLLKMAFIKEGLEDYSDALYFLNLYYRKTYDKRVLKKMENLAKAHHLTGYEYDDTEFFLNLYHQYYNQIIFSLMAITFLIFAILIYHKRHTGESPHFAGAIFILFLLFLFYVNNFGREHPKAIIDREHTYLMTGPSAGAGVMDIINKGHRVEILNSNKVWSKIRYQDRIAYVRNNSIKTLDY